MTRDNVNAQMGKYSRHSFSTLALWWPRILFFVSTKCISTLTGPMKLRVIDKGTVAEIDSDTEAAEHVAMHNRARFLKGSPTPGF